MLFICCMPVFPKPQTFNKFSHSCNVGHSWLISQSCADSHEENGLILKMKVEFINFKGISGFVTCFYIPVKTCQNSRMFLQLQVKFYLLASKSEQDTVFSKQKMDIDIIIHILLHILIVICPSFFTYYKPFALTN